MVSRSHKIIDNTLLCAIDAGNTQVKAGWFDTAGKQHGLVSTIPYNHGKLLKVIQKYERLTRAYIYSSVRSDDTATIAALSSAYKLHVLGAHSQLPFSNKYGSPKTLGKDRIANMAAAAVLFGKKNVLIVDAGTCIKLDMLHADNHYEGGSIHPGIKMRLNALHDYTGKLPKLRPEIKKVSPLYVTSTSGKLIEFGIGNTTELSMRVGAHLGALQEIKSCLAWYRKKYKNLQTVITGGDMRFYAQQMKFTFAIPHLTLIGLHAILKLNMNE